MVTRYATIHDVRSAPGFQERLGNCYELAARHVVDTPGATLVHGSIQNYGLPPNPHAWAVNPDGTVHDAVLQRDLHPDDFERLFNPDARATYDRDETLYHLVMFEVWGPWDDDEDDDDDDGEQNDSALTLEPA